MTVNEQAANDCKDNINEVISLIGKEGCVESLKSLKNKFPKIYAYKCELLGCDPIEYVKDLLKAC